jgi:hypothetical protein
MAMASPVGHCEHYCMRTSCLLQKDQPSDPVLGILEGSCKGLLRPYISHWASTNTTKCRRGIVAYKSKLEPGHSKYQLGGTIMRNQPRTLCHTHHHPILSPRSQFVFILRHNKRVWHHPGRSTAEAKNCNAAIWWPSYPHHIQSCTFPHLTHMHWPSRATSMHSCSCRIKHAHPRFCIGGILLQSTDCL